ncbi:MAG: hypothetical protein H0W48_00395 [Methylibium sp.]|nr:hypothetical protein [Methylibium sp.]
MSNALSFITGLAQGGIGAHLRSKDDDRRKKDDEWREEQRAWMRKDREEAGALKSAVSDAAKPVSMVDASVYSPSVDDEGNAMPANPTAGRMSVLGQSYNDPAQAQAALQQANSPNAQMSRVADAYSGAGQAEKAISIRASMRQNEVADLQAESLKARATQERMMRGLGKAYRVGGVDALANFATENYDDGKTYKAERGQGEAFTMVQFGKDGKEIGRQPFETVDEFVKIAAAEADPLKFIESKQAAAEAGRKEAREDRRLDSKEAREDRRIDIQDRRADMSERRMESLIAATTARAKGEGAPGAVAIEDFRKFNGDFAAYLPDTKTATTPEEASAITSKNARTTAQAQAMFQTNAGFGVVLTAPEVRAAMEAAQDPKNVQIRPNNGQMYETVTINGKTVATSGAVQARPPAPPAAAGAAAEPPKRDAARPPAVDRLGDGIIGPLTPMSMILDSAAAGNPRAIEYLQQRDRPKPPRMAAPPSSGSYAAP